MTTAREVAEIIELWAPLSIQESWDNAGFCTGLPQTQVKGVLLCLDVTHDVIEEALALGTNMIISHHPLIFHGLKQLCGQDEVAKMIIKALKHDLVIYSSHTNADKVEVGVSGLMAKMLDLQDVKILNPDSHHTPVTSNVTSVSAVATPVGLGMVGNLPSPQETHSFLQTVKQIFKIPCLRVSPLTVQTIRRVAVCGGSGSSLIGQARERGADIYLSGDFSYHHFFPTSGEMMIADVGHYESEIGIVYQLAHLLSKKNLTFAVSITKHNTNPIHYF